MKILAIVLLTLGLSFTVYADYPAESYGADPSLSDNSTQIQTALDDAGVHGGGTVTVTKPGVYLLKTQGAHPYRLGHRYCLDIRYDNITFSLGNGVTLQLASNQQINEPVDIVVFRARKNLTFSGGTISGNTAGQPWGGGYSQVDNGVIISGYGTVDTFNSNITIKDITLKNHFSNPINIDVSGGSPARNRNIRISNVHASDCGEGIQVISADDVWITDCIVDSPNHVSIGDAIEISNVTRAHLSGNTSKNHRSGSGFDLFESQHVILENFICDDDVNCVGIEGFGGNSDPQDVLVVNGSVTNPSNPTGTGVCDAIELSALTLDNIKIKNVSMKGTAYSYGFMIQSIGSSLKSTGPVFIEDCNIDGGIVGIFLLDAVSDITISGGSYTHMFYDGISYAFQGNGLASADVKNFVVRNVNAINNTRYGIYINNEGFLVPEMSGAIKDCYLQGNGSDPIKFGPEGNGLTIEGNVPATRNAPGGFSK